MTVRNCSRSATAIVLFAFSLAVGCRRPSTPEAARQAYRERRFDYAVKAWTSVLKASPKSGEALYGLGLAYLANGNAAAAEGRIARSLDLLEGRPEQKLAYVKLCDLYLERHRTERLYLDAVWQMTRYMGSRFPNDFDFARVNAQAAEAEAALASARGDIHSADRWWANSAELWEHAATLKPNDPVVLSGLGRAYQGMGEFAKADEMWRLVLESDPSAREANLAHLSNIMQRRATEELRGAVREAVKARPNDERFLTTMAGALIAQRGPEEVKLVVGRLQELARANRADWVTVGRLYEQAGMMNEALRSYTTGAESKSQSAETSLKNEIRILMNEHRLDEASQKLRSLSARGARDPETRILEARVSLAQGETDDAIAKLLQISSTYQNREVALWLARAYAKKESYSLAQNLLQSWDRAHPDDPEVLYALADIELKLGNASGAAFAAQRAEGDRARK
jgi:tetratricopeptide (TPR) repeat protein